MIKLTILSGPDAGSVFTLAASTIIIGRGSDCDVVLHDSLVSRRHCQIQHEEGQVVVSDLHTANGVFLNDTQTRIETHVLNNGDKIICGKSFLSVELLTPQGKGKRNRKSRKNDSNSLHGELPASAEKASLNTKAVLAVGSPASVKNPAPLVDTSALSESPSAILPQNWQSGMTVFVPRAKILTTPESEEHPTARLTEYGHQSLLVRIVSAVKRIGTALAGSLARQPQ
jgi:pSer/pThr/pTyr-binding forkhead associated (FHA) protein